MSSDTSSQSHTHSPFLSGALGVHFARTALPIIFVMSMNGLLAVADAIFLGLYVGPEALAAVTLIFPIYMLMVALSTLVSNGLASILARQLGAGQIDEARAHFSGAHGLALLVGALFILGYLTFGKDITLAAANGSKDLADLATIYLRLMVFASPLVMVLSLHVDTLRNEGFAPIMAAMSLLVSLANIGFNALFIIWLGLGIAGSAYGTIAAQLLAFTIIIGFRHWGPSTFKPLNLMRHSLTTGWRPILALGAPQSLGFVGMSIIATATITALQWVGSSQYGATISAYGIITRMMTFYFLPLLGLGQAMQSILGSNYGAALWLRSDKTLRIALGAALTYSLLAQALFMLAPDWLGSLFVTDSAVIGEVQRILPKTTLLMFTAGPIFIIATYFQAIGDVPRSAILSLSKTYCFMLPLIFILPFLTGEVGIWFASPIADVLMVAITLPLLRQMAQKTGYQWGLFAAPTKVQS
nr:MATE family efflux transporter [uncultured Cohaesibacter sp.]